MLTSTRHRFAATVAISLLLSACAGGEPNPTSPVAAIPQAMDGEFMLEIAASRATWAADKPIDVEATLTYLGPREQASIGGSGAGPIAFSIAELGGTRRLDGVMSADCAAHVIQRDAPFVTPFVKSGAYDPGEPNEAFYRAFLADPGFRLPVGRWHVSAWAAFNSEAGCSGRQVDMRASLILTVE